MDATSSEISGQSRDGPRKNAVSLKYEDKEFVTKFKQVINHEDVKYPDEDNSNMIGIKDPYLNMELGIRHNDKRHASR